jgi:cytochrome P450
MDCRILPPHDLDERKTAELTASNRGCPLDHRADGSIGVNSYALASQILRSGNTKQAGFNAKMVELFPQKNKSVLFKEGNGHRLQRLAAARFFAPKVVTERYRRLMSDLSIRLVERLKRDRKATLDDMSLELSVAVAAEIVGLTESIAPGMGKRLNRMFDLEAPVGGNWFAIALYIFRAQANLLMVFLLDVLPAIRSRRRHPREDLISHLLEQKWSTLDLLTECVTYSTAGMSTTREFIVVAAWHLLEREDLRQRFLAGEESGRIAVLEEILRLEPPVGTLFRKSTGPLTLDGEHVEAGTLLAIDVRAVNADETVAGACPHRLDPDRKAAHMSFGDGHHKCPGLSVALQETAIFLNELLPVPGLRLAQTPVMGWNTMTMGYVLRKALLTVDG